MYSNFSPPNPARTMHLLTEQGLSPPHALPLSTAAIRRVVVTAASPPSRQRCRLVVPRLGENSPTGHLAPHQPKTLCGSRGRSFPRGTAVTHRGRGALRLSQ